MSKYYNAIRTRNLYDPAQEKPFKLSRTKVGLYLECPRCFYIDRRLGVGRPPGFPFTLNSAVDTLLKREFDGHRQNGTRHPLMEKYKIDALPIFHEDLEKWRNNFVGVQYLHEPTNLLLFGAIDDLWQNRDGEYIVVDYKATAKKGEILELDQDWQDGYKRQMEFYQWLLRKNGHMVSDTGYFVYCNGDAEKALFNCALEFDVTLIPYTGTDEWVEKTIEDIHNCLNSNIIPEPSPGCDYCAYINAIDKVSQ